MLKSLRNEPNINSSFPENCLLVKLVQIVIFLILHKPECVYICLEIETKKGVMKKKTLLFFVLALITGLVGFTGLSFSGIEVIRVMFLIFADLMIISLMAKLFFPDKPKVKYQPVERK